MFAADLDGDGDIDVLSASQGDNKIAWYENTDGLGAFGPQQVITTAARGAHSVFAADLDGDGDIDVLSASFVDFKIAWYENTDGLGAFGPQQVITTAADWAWSVFAADLDGDGDPDVLSASSHDNKIAWYENTDGLGAFGPQQVITTALNSARSVFAADLDGDGDIDVLSASQTDFKIAWYENTDGMGAFGPQQVITTSANHPQSVYAADLDGDGDIDVLSASVGDDKIAWYENTDGLGAFGPQQVITRAADGAYSVYAADLDGDGDVDVLSASIDDDKIAWYENLSPIEGITVGPPTIDFGLVGIDDSSTVAIAIQSGGPDSLKVTSISSPGTPFTLTNLPTLPTVIPAGGSETFDVIFSPTSPGIVNGTITIASNDSDDPTVDVTLSGQGVETALLSGAVRDNLNNAPITATLEFIRQGEATPRAIITTNSDGFYEIVVIVGTYDINILAFPYLQARRENIEHSSGGTMFDILLPPPPQIALVEDDSTGSAGEIIGDILGELGLEPAVWNPIERGRIVPIDRINLLAEPRILFWVTGEGTTDALTAAERFLIIEHLDNGNSLILSGQNIAEFAQTNDALMTSYLGVTFNINISPSTVKGFTNDPIGDGLSMFARGSSKDQLQLSASPIGQINKVFSYGSSEKDSIRIAAVRAQNPDKGWKAVYFGFGVADILTSTNRKKVIQRSIDWIIDSVLVSVEYPDIATLPLTFHLEQNYPNPFNPETTIAFSLANSTVVEVTIYNVSGQKIRELVNDRYSAGEHFVKWDGRDAFGSTVSSGVYLYKIQTAEFTALRKMVLLK